MAQMQRDYDNGISPPKMPIYGDYFNMQAAIRAPQPPQRKLAQHVKNLRVEYLEILRNKWKSKSN